MKVLLLDNFDSFTYNLWQYAAQFASVDVKRNTLVSLNQVADYHAIILSPGPGLPADAGIMPQLLTTYYPTKPILGICLGIQAIAECFGGQLYNLPTVYHGLQRQVVVTKPDGILFKGLGDSFEAGRYHSWAVEKDSLPQALEITAVDTDGVAMALQHKTLPVYGVQFHPESIMTPNGLKIIENFIKSIKQ